MQTLFDVIWYYTILLILSVESVNLFHNPSSNVTQIFPAIVAFVFGIEFVRWEFDVCQRIQNVVASFLPTLSLRFLKAVDRCIGLSFGLKFQTHKAI